MFLQNPYGVPSQAYPQEAVPGGWPYGADPNPNQQQQAPVAPQAVIQMPRAGEMGGRQPGVPPWIRTPYYPTAPFYSTDPNVGYQTRFYSVGLLSTEADYAVNSESIRTIQFDIPARLIGFAGASFNVAAGNALPTGVGPRDTFLFRAEYTNGDRLHINARMASTVVGTMERPGEIGGTGWTIDQGASFIVGITPLLANLRIDVTLICLEMRGPRNFR